MGNVMNHFKKLKTTPEKAILSPIEPIDRENEKYQVELFVRFEVLYGKLKICQGKVDSLETLLRPGADLNSPDEDGSTPLHILCRGYPYNNTNYAELFFLINDELHKQRAQVDAKDKLGRTPLQLAVTYLKPSTIDLLLDRGADLSSFVFPSEINFQECFDEFYLDELIGNRLMLASSLLAVIERLENRGYELSRKDALTTMKLFSKYGLFEKSMDFEKSNWCNDEEIAREAKKTMVNSSLSLYDLIQLRPEESAKLFTYQDSVKLADAIGWWGFPKICKEAFCAHLCEKIARRFFWRWAMDPFMELIHCRLPHLPCEMIMENLKNEDLFHICLAESG